MIFSGKASIPALLLWCRTLRHESYAGISLVKSFKRLAKSGPASLRAKADLIAKRLEKGKSLEDALAPESRRFPSLFIEMTTLGEQTGRLTETFEELERHFEGVVSVRKQLYSALTWPAIMYVSAILVIALMTAILGLIGKWDPIGFGVGTGPAIRFLFAAAIFTILLIMAFFVVRETEEIRGKVEAYSLMIPGLGDCFRCFALQRFSTAMYMAAEAGLHADRMLHMAFRATTNDAYRAFALSSAKRAHDGETLTEILASLGPRLFPEVFVESLEVGEISGQVAEAMHKQSQILKEEAIGKLRFLTTLLGGLVYAGVALMIIFVIFRMVMSIMNVYNDALNGL